MRDFLPRFGKLAAIARNSDFVITVCDIDFFSLLFCRMYSGAVTHLCVGIRRTANVPLIWSNVGCK